MIGAIQGGKYSATIAKRLEDLEEEDCRVKRNAKKHSTINGSTIKKGSIDY
jgi:hypothetical protein